MQVAELGRIETWSRLQCKETINTLTHSSKVKRKSEQTSRKDDAAGSLGRKEIDMRFSFTNWTLASI